MQSAFIPLYTPQSPTAASMPSAMKEARVKQKMQDPDLCNSGSGMFAFATAKVNESETIAFGVPESPPSPPIKPFGGQSESETFSPLASRMDTEWLDKSIQYLNELRGLPANWDSYGAKAPNPIICDLVQRILFDLSELDLPEPFLAPVANGSIYLKFEVPPREIGIEFDDPIGRYASCLFVLNLPREVVQEKAIHLSSEFKSAIFWLLGENQREDLIA